MSYPRRLSAVLAASFLAITAPLTLTRPAEAAERAETYTFAFQDADIRQVVDEVLGQAGVPYAIDPGVTGKISFRIEQRLNRDQLIAALGAALEASGFTLVQNNGQVIVTPQAKAKAAAPIRRGAAGAGEAGYEIVALPLSYAQPTEVAKALEAIVGTDAVLYANDKLGLILVAGGGPQLKSTLQTLKLFDQNGFEDARIRWFELNQAPATAVATDLERIVQGAGVVGVTIVPLKRLNGVLVFGRSAEALDAIGKWVQRLDTAGKDEAASLFVYHPRNAAADQLARTLSGVFGLSSVQGGGASAPQTPAPSALASPAEAPGRPPTLTAEAGGTPAASGATLADQIRISVDKDTNTLLISTPQNKIVQIQRVLGEIDRPPRQVFIEASIVEVTLGKENQFGVDWQAFSDRLSVSSVNNKTGTVGPVYPGLSITYLGNDITAALTALGSKTNLEVRSAPKIIALDGRTARLQIGDQVPVVIQSQQTTTTPNPNLVSTIDYRSTGVILAVTPRITGEDQLLVDVSQEVSSVAKTVTSGIDSPTIQQRRFESALVLKDGGVVALGGLISSTRSLSGSGVPGLKDLPAVGALFRTSSRTQTRSELIVLLRAKILNDPSGAPQVIEMLAQDMHELEIRGLLPDKHP